MVSISIVILFFIQAELFDELIREIKSHLPATSVGVGASAKVSGSNSSLGAESASLPAASSSVAKSKEPTSASGGAKPKQPTADVPSTNQTKKSKGAEGNGNSKKSSNDNGSSVAAGKATAAPVSQKEVKQAAVVQNTQSGAKAKTATSTKASYLFLFNCFS